MFISTLIYFEQKYFVRYGKITFWFLLPSPFTGSDHYMYALCEKICKSEQFYFYKKCKFREISRSVHPLMSQNAFEMTLRYDQMHYNHSIYSIIRARQII